MQSPRPRKRRLPISARTSTSTPSPVLSKQPGDWFLLSTNTSLGTNRGLAAGLYRRAERGERGAGLPHPVMRESTAKSWTQMGLGDIKTFDLAQLHWGQLHLGTKLGEVQAVFPRADKSAVERMQKMEEQSTSVGTGASPVQPSAARQPG